MPWFVFVNRYHNSILSVCERESVCVLFSFSFPCVDVHLQLLDMKSFQVQSKLLKKKFAGIDFQVDASSLKSIQENVGIQATRCPIDSSKKNPQAPGRVLVEGTPLSTPLKVTYLICYYVFT